MALVEGKSRMTQRRSDDGDLSVGGYHVERLDNVSNRLSYVEGQMKSMATKEDVANAKLYLIITGVGLLVVFLVGIAGMVARFWPQ